MATLSDLANSAVPAPAPSWIGALEASQGFLPIAGLPLSQGNCAEDAGSGDFQADAIADAFAKGEAAGRSAAQEEQAQSHQHVQALTAAFGQLDAAAKDVLRQHLVETVTRLCLQVIEPHLIDQDQLEKRCTKAAAVLGEAPAICRLHLNPEDAEMLDPQFASQWTIALQPDRTRGSLRLEGPDGVLNDGPAEWRNAIAAALLP